MKPVPADEINDDFKELRDSTRELYAFTKAIDHDVLNRLVENHLRALKRICDSTYEDGVKKGLFFEAPTQKQ